MSESGSAADAGPSGLPSIAAGRDLPHEENPSGRGGRQNRCVTYAAWGLAGIVLVGLHLHLSGISSEFVYGSPMRSRPIPDLVGTLVLAGAIYLTVASTLAPRGSGGRPVLGWIVVAGLGMRAALLLSHPMLENDFYRYAWDGAVVVRGYNPYSFSPEEVATAEVGSGVPLELRDLAKARATDLLPPGAAPTDERIVDRISYPHLRTCYPPLSEQAFALAHRMKPWSLVTWRLVLGTCDAAALVLLVVLLRTLRLPLALCAVYWWNPLLVKETYNSCHVDVVALPLVLGAVLLAVRERHVLAAGLLAAGAAVKVWPVLLVPVLLRPAARRPGRLVAAVVVFVALTAGLFYPLAAAGLDESSGLVTFGRRWELNDALFMAIKWAVRPLAEVEGIEPGAADRVAGRIARAAVAAALVAWVVGRVRRPIASGRDLAGRCLAVVAAAFLLSPAQFPHYSLWFLPFLAIRPRLSLLLLTVLLPVYYLRFLLWNTYADLPLVGEVHVFDDLVVWVQYVPVWGLLVSEWYAGRKRRRAPAEVVG